MQRSLRGPAGPYKPGAVVIFIVLSAGAYAAAFTTGVALGLRRNRREAAR